MLVFLHVLQVLCDEVIGDGEKKVRSLESESKSGAEISTSVLGLENTDELIHMIDENGKALEHVYHLFSIWTFVHDLHHALYSRKHVLYFLELLVLNCGFWASILIILVVRLTKEDS